MTQVTAVTASTPLLAANGLRNGDGLSVVIANDSTAIMYILLGAADATSSNYSYALAGNGGGVSKDVSISGYRGPIQAVWASVNGKAQVTEIGC